MNMAEVETQTQLSREENEEITLESSLAVNGNLKMCVPYDSANSTLR